MSAATPITLPYGQINGLWQLDPGHARGLEEKSYADQMYAAVHRAIEEGKAKGVGEANSIKQLYRDDEYHIDYWFKYLGLTGQPVTQTLAQFYTEYGSDPNRSRPLLRGADRGPRADEKLVLQGHRRW